MSFRDKRSFGLRIEYKIMSKLLEEGYDVYTPLVDDHGVDCVVRKEDGTFIQLQIKARSKNADCKSDGQFSVGEHEKQDNFFFIFYHEKTNKTWRISSNDFVSIKPIQSGKNAGTRKITLVTIHKDGEYYVNKKYSKYLITNFSFLKQ